jgi:thymidine phosphorylase
MRLHLSKTSTSDLERIFRENVVAQGGDLDALDSILQEVEQDHSEAISAIEDGFAHFNLQSLRSVMVDWQNSCTVPGQPFSDPVGIVLVKRSGEWVCKREILATVRIQGLPTAKILSDLSKHIGVTSIPLSMYLEGIEL